MAHNLYFIILFAPLLSAAFVGIFGRQLGDKPSMFLASTGVGLSMVLSIVAFIEIAVLDGAALYMPLYNWIVTESFSASFGLYLDKLTVVMLLLVTVVSTMVHVYSIGYMAEDPDKPRFFSYLSLFTFMMLALVTAPNLPQLFLGWEGVGLASYLLICFWHHKESANAASLKAFLVNRVADVGLILAMLIGFIAFGSLNFEDIFAAAPVLQRTSFSFLGMEANVLELFSILLFIGAMGKSAQLGLHTWLPDAMEGPTPVSALIHAATMVTAGVFLLARMSPVLEFTTYALELIAWVGALTAIFAATIGLTQTDIKRVIAYSTCSQLGYMFFAVGVSAYSGAMFHLFTHGFFKALLFLGAGSVIHALHHEQELFKMGGVYKLLPITYVLIWIGSLALVGVPPFAGFFSKDFVLEAALMSGSQTGTILYAMGTFAAFLTAFYSFRLLFLAFHGQFRGEEKTFKSAHESPLVMTVPMLILAVGAIASGYLGLSMTETDWWQGAIIIFEDVHPGVVEAHNTPLLLKLLPLFVGILGFTVAWLYYVRKPASPAKIAQTFDLVYKASLNKWYIDELYRFMILKPICKLGTLLWRHGDMNIDRFGPDGIAAITQRIGLWLKPLQSGYIYHYIFILVIGLTVLLTFVLIQ